MTKENITVKLTTDAAMGKSFIKIPLSHNATTAALIAADNTDPS
jgi:peptidyl-tRNA hydrolase